VFHAFFNQSAAELGVQLGGTVLVLVPVFWAMLRTRPDTLNRQIDALARKTRARDAT